MAYFKHIYRKSTDFLDTMDNDIYSNISYRNKVLTKSLLERGNDNGYRL